MKKILKIAIGVGALIVAGVVVVKIIKEESKKLDNEEKKINKEFEDLGLSKEKVKEDTKDKEQEKSKKIKMDKNRREEDLDESRHIKERIEKTRKPIEEEITYEYEYDETLDDDE